MSNSFDLSRRTFLAGAAAAGAVAAAGVAAASADEAAWLPEAWDYETDVLVIGYGGAGVWAALTAADEGASEVLILEKAPVRGGGNSSINLGEFTIPVDAAGCALYIKSFTAGLVPDSMCEAWANEAVRNGEYATLWGLPWVQNAGTLASRYTESCEYPFLPGSDSMAIGAIDGYGMNFWDIMDANRADMGIEVLFSVTNEELIQNPETKEILGCYADYEGKRIAIKARKGTILTLGGFEFNEELKNEYLKVYPALGFYGWPYNTGDGIKMVQKVGAQLWHMNCMIGGANPNFHDPEYPFAIQLSPKSDNYIWVNRVGKRWRNEKASSSPHVGWHQWLPFDDSICGFERIPTWAVIDQTAFEAGMLGPDPTARLARGMYAPTLPKELGRYDGWSADNQAEVDRGWVLKGETIEELVAKMNEIDPGMMTAEALQATIDTYNGYCAAGEDPDFGRPADNLLPVEKAPFYAWPIYPGGCSTLGGPKKNENAQVVDFDDNPIPRLYAAGCFGNFAAHTYGISGGNNAENMVWGRISARHAASLTPWDAE
ncbi:MAG: FAD-binding protein [Coriobacteriales bacterium]|nr:FAD-binding protein [Coriobacteriales bacterium]